MLAYCAANYARTHLVKYNETTLHFMFAILSLTQSYVKKKKKHGPNYKTNRPRKTRLDLFDGGVGLAGH